MRGDRRLRRSYHEAMLEAKRSIIDERKRLGAQYLQENPDWVRRSEGVLTSDGLGIADHSEVPWMQETLAMAQSIVADRAGRENPSKGSLEFFASGKNAFGPDSPVLQLALSPAFLVPVISYFGMLPVLFSMDISRASAKELLTATSHLLHLDPEDVTQLKVFTYINGADRDIAFHAIPAPYSERLADHLGYSVGRVTDERACEILGGDRAVAAPGPPGTTIFCDTNRCFHFGGRPGRTHRDMLTFVYALPTSTWFPQPGGDGERRNLTPLLKADPSKAYWNALIGEDLV